MEKDLFEPADPSLNNKAAKTNKQKKLYKGTTMHSANNIFLYMEILFLTIVHTFSVMGEPNPGIFWKHLKNSERF